MDIQAFGKRPEMMAPGCPIGEPTKSCSFDEFVDYIQKDGHHLASGQKTSVGNKLWPEVVETAKELSNLKLSNGKTYVANWDPQKLFKAGTSTQPNIRLSDILKDATNRIQAARAHLGDDAFKEGDEDGLKEARRAITGTHEGRLGENGQDYINAINDYLKDERDSNTKVDIKEPTAIDGSTYITVDVDATKAKDPAFAGHWTEFQNWMKTQSRNKKSALGKFKLHWDAIQEVQKLESRVLGDSTC